MNIRPVESISQNYSHIKRKMDNDYNANQTVWKKMWIEGNIDTNLEAGITYNTQSYALPFAYQNSPFYFNRVRPLLNMVSGWQRENRKSSIVVPLSNGDQQTADQWTKLILNLYKREGIYETISEAFHQGALITGMNLLHVYLDFTNDSISGDIKVDNLAYNQFFIDPYFRKDDLSDCNFVWRRSYLTHLAAATLMPSKWDEIMKLPGNPTGVGRDGKFEYEPEARGQAGKNLIAYDEYYYKDFRKQKKLVDKYTGEYLDVTMYDNEHIRNFLRTNPGTYVEDVEIPTVRLCIRIQDHVFYDGPQPDLSDSYNFVPVIGYYSSSLAAFSARIQGIARSLRDPQALLNRRIILSADLLESQVNSGWKFKEGAPLDINHLLQTGQGRLIPVKKGFELADVEQIPSPRIDPSIFQMQEVFNKELFFTSGITEENMGFMVDQGASGFKTRIRQMASMTALKPLFDRLNKSQILLTNRIMDIVQKNYTPAKVMEFLEGDEPAPLFFKQAFGKYHSQIQEGYDTESQRQMQFAQLIELRNAGIQVPDADMIEAATIQNKEQLLANMQARQQQQDQLQQQQAQSLMQVQQAQTGLAQARAMADMALSRERDSHVVTNNAQAIEKISESNKEDELALLNKIKILKEIDEMDIGHLERLLNLASNLKGKERQEAL